MIKIVHLPVSQFHGLSAETNDAEAKDRNAGKGTSERKPERNRFAEYADTQKITQDWNAHGQKRIYATGVRINS
jgi:hypothetical protein